MVFSPPTTSARQRLGSTRYLIHFRHFALKHLHVHQHSKRKTTIFQFSGNTSVKIMAKVFRRAANKVKNSRDGHGSLGLLIFDEKVVYETFQKVVIAKADGEFLSYPSLRVLREKSKS